MWLHRHIFFLLFLFSPTAKAQTPVIDSLLKIVALDKKDSVQMVAILNLSSEYSRIDIKKAKDNLYAAISIAHSMHLNRGLSAAYGQMVLQQINTGMPDSATYYLGLLKQLAIMNPGTTIEVNYYFTTGAFYRIQGDFKAAIPYMKKGLAIQTAINNNVIPVSAEVMLTNKTFTAGQTLNIGNNYHDMLDIKNALTYHLQALRLFEDIHNKRGESFCLQSVGQDLIMFKRYNDALPYVLKALTLKNELNDKRGVATAVIALGQVYLGMKNHDKALEYAIQALQLNHDLKIIPEEAKSNYFIGEVYAAKGDIKTAADYFNKSKMLAMQLKDSSLAANASAQITGFELSENKQKATEKKLFSSLQTSVEKGDRLTEVNSYKFLSNFYATNKQYDKALDYNEKFHAVQDSIENNELQVQLKRLEQQYSLEKKEKEIVLKEKEIALLKKDQELRNTELQKERAIKAGAFILAALLAVIGLLVVNRYRVIQKAKRMVEIEKLRNDIARDLHDDIGSALSSININSNMALNRSDDGTVVKAQLEKIKANSGRIMESMGDIVWAINPGNDSMENLSVKMKEFLSEILEPMNVNYSLTESENLKKLKLPVDRRKELYLVFKEAVNNAAKYSHCKNITVVLNGDNRQLEMQVGDDGNGFDKLLGKMGNGLRNMQQRAAAMGGEFRIDTAPGAGTRLVVTVPVT